MENALKSPPRTYTLNSSAERVLQRAPLSTPHTSERLDQECAECSVFFTGELSYDGMCGANCRDIRAEMDAEADPRDSYPMDTLRAVAETVRERPQIEYLKIDYCEGSPTLTARMAGRKFDSPEEFDLALSQIRRSEAYTIKVYARLKIVGGDVYTFRPDQFCAKSDVHEGRSHTLCRHFTEYAARLRELAEGHQPNGSSEEMHTKADAYQVVVDALGG